MHHDHDVGPFLQGFPVTGLLVRPVSPVHRMHMDLHAGQRTCLLDRQIAAGIIHQNNLVNNALVHDLAIGLLQRLLRVVRGHNDHDFLGFIHRVISLS